MTRGKPTCPKCSDWRVQRLYRGTEFEEFHCFSCGLIVHVGLLRKQRDVTRHPSEDEGMAA